MGFNRFGRRRRLRNVCLFDRFSRRHWSSFFDYHGHFQLHCGFRLMHRFRHRLGFWGSSFEFRFGRNRHWLFCRWHFLRGSREAVRGENSQNPLPVAFDSKQSVPLGLPHQFVGAGQAELALIKRRLE